MKILLAFLLLFSANALASTGGIYTTHVTAPDDPNYPTDAKCAAHASDSEVTLITTAAGLTNAVLNTASIKYFCVQPGADYTAVELDSITQSGSDGDRRYLRYYDPNETYEVMPWDAAERVELKELYFLSNVNYWTVDRITLRDTVKEAPIRAQPTGGQNITFNRMYVYDSGGPAGAVALGGANVIWQNSVIRNTKLTVDTDDHCITAYGDNLKLVGNEHGNCTGDPLEISTAALGGVLAGNYLYTDEDYYSDCLGNLTPGDPSGGCYCSENAVGFKGGGQGSFPYTAAWPDFDTGTEMLFARNIIRGYGREGDRGNATGCEGAGGVGVTGISLGANEDGDGVHIKDNVFLIGPNSLDGQAIVHVSRDQPNDFLEHWSFTNNLFDGYDKGIALAGNQSRYNTVSYNTWLDADVLFAGAENYNDVKCNVIINNPDESTNPVSSHLSEWDFNARYNSQSIYADMQGPGDISRSTAAESNNEEYCVALYPLTNPTEHCIPLASTTATSPHATMCDSPSETTGWGISNEPVLTRAAAGFVAPKLQRTMEYEESAPVIVSLKETRSFKFVAPVTDTYQFHFKGSAPDASSNELDFDVDAVSSGATVVFGVPSTGEWRQGWNMSLDAGIHTITVTLTEPVEVDKILVTNDPEYVSLEPEDEGGTPLPPSGMEMMQMGKAEKHDITCLWHFWRFLWG